jgi:glycosyltransferase involved in cell wall biosynthesis
MPATVGLMIAAFSDARFSFTAHARDLYIRPALLAPKLAAAHRAVGCTEFNRSLLARGVPWAVARRIVAVHHGIDATYFTEGNATRPEPPLVLAAGRLVAKKGFDVLIGACARLRRDGVEFRCEIAGDGPLREALEQRIRANALASTVRLIGQQSQGQLRELYRTATVLAMPCVVGPDGDHDGLPNVLLEAAGCGAALVSTPVGGVTELIRDGETGLLAAPGSADELADAIRHLLSDPDLRGRLAAAARCEVEQHFNIQTNVRRLAEVLGLLPAAAKS